MRKYMVALCQSERVSVAGSFTGVLPSVGMSKSCEMPPSWAAHARTWCRPASNPESMTGKVMASLCAP